MRTSLIVLTVAVLLIVGTVLVFQRNQTEPPVENGGNVVTSTPSIVTGEVSPTPMRSENIIVTSPQSGTAISSPVVIRGEARTFENSVSVRLTEQGGRVLIEDFTTANSPDIGQFGPFEISLSYPKPSQQSGMIEVFQYSARDGSETDKVTIPVTFQTTDELTVQVFFNNTSRGAECEKVLPTNRQIPYTQQTARAALEELLKGPSQAEKNQGYISSINPGIRIQRLSIENGVAYVDFDSKLEDQIGGSCRVTAIRAQITQTLLQFETVNSVIISVNGRTEDILQP